MESLFSIILLLLIFFAEVYLILMAFYTFGWFSTKAFGVSNQKSKSFIGIIIPARNEEKNIGDCLQALLDQDFPKQQFEIIVVNDHSEDQTKTIVQKFIQDFPENNISIINLSDKTKREKTSH